MNQVIKGYKYLLAQGVVHRDIKPANILRVGNKWKISDFGFATRAKFGFKDRMNVGTPLYMAPESLKKNYYSYKSDFFSLGMVLYEMIEGCTPWEVDNERDLIEKMSDDIVLPKHVKNVKIADLLAKCCQIH
jgi:serine/threonine protein kinase